MSDKGESAARIVALNLDVPLGTKRKLQDVVRDLEDLHNKKASMTGVLVQLVEQALAADLAEHFPDVRARRRGRGV